MSANNENIPTKLKALILNAKQPIILRKFQTKWLCCEKSLEDWCNNFSESKNGAEVEFEQMSTLSSTGHPQWERERQKIKMTMQEFLKHKETKEHWIALNYQTPNEIPDKCKESVDFNCFGFPDLTNDYARFWLSTPNANTPCHKDTYGCNVVVQVFGSKLWLLFPPHAPLTATRLPYEESSVYCMENFYAPDSKQVVDLKRLESFAHICTLEAGDALIVPRFWWHFVETKKTSLSINAWIPLEIDKHAQLEECIVKFIIETIARKEQSDVVDYMLNPNQKETLPEVDILGILAFLANKINSKDFNEENQPTEAQSYAYQYLNEVHFETLLNNFPGAFVVERSSCTEYNALIANNSMRFVKIGSEESASGIGSIKEALINSLCDEKVLAEIIKEFNKRLLF